MIGVCAFGYDFHALEQGRDNHPYVKSVYCVTDAIYERAFKPWLYSSFVWERSALGKEYMKACDIIHTVKIPSSQSSISSSNPVFH